MRWVFARIMAAAAALVAVSAGPPAAQTVRVPTVAELRGDEDEKQAVALPEVPVFARALLERQYRGALAAANAGDIVSAELQLRSVLAAEPDLRAPRVMLAQVLAARGALDDAVATLRRAYEAGFRDPNLLITARIFQRLGEREDFKTLVSEMRLAPRPRALTPPPAAVSAPILDGRAPVTAANSEWSEGEQAVRAYFAGLPPPPIPTARRPDRVATGGSEAERLVNRWYAEGRAAGNRGDFYENRDGGHSMLDTGRFPQLTLVEHGPEAVDAGWHRGTAEGLALTLGAEAAPPLFGNSSTAVVDGPYWRSMARLALTEPFRPEELARQYMSNQLYIYPEHKDHDPFYGDVFPAMTPYMIVTQGSSWSDETAMNAMALMLAAMPPDVKRVLTRERLIAPTLQMLWRRGQDGIETDEDYLSARAHPTVFDPETADMTRLVRLANDLSALSLPPVVLLDVVEERRPAPGITVFGDGLSEVLFDTPSAIARAFRRTDREMRMIVSAARTADPNALPLRFHWKVLRGAEGKVRVTPLDERGLAAEIVVEWHDRPTRTEDGLRAPRVDIAVFADNANALSAPGFVSVLFPPRQKRIYDENERLQEIEYDAAGRLDEYVDPRLFPERGWRDRYQYLDDGFPDGWRRLGARGPVRFTRHGAMVVDDDLDGRPFSGSVMRYPLLPSRDGRRRAAPTPTREGLLYEYDGRDDRKGVARQVRLTEGDLR